jgi:hypothetical protein
MLPSITTVRYVAIPTLAMILACGRADADDLKSAENLLITVLTGEFSGVDGSRVAKIVHMSSSPRIVGDCACGADPDEYFVTADPIVVVSKWDLPPHSGTRTEQGVTFNVTFHDIAVTEGQGMPSSSDEKGRSIVPIQGGKDEVVTYNLVMRDGRWKLLDPPLPRVSSQDLRQSFVEFSLRLPVISRKTSEPHQDLHGGIPFLEGWIAQQLSVLDKLI